MKDLKIVDYEEGMLDEMMQLFYDTVHTVSAKDYRKDQLNTWAPADINRKFWEDRLKKNVCKVAFIDDTMVGFTELVDENVETMYVHKDFQRRKVAANLIDEVLQIARERNYRVITTEASLTARPFFEAHGFEVTKVKKKLFNGKDFMNFKMKKELAVW